MRIRLHELTFIYFLIEKKNVNTVVAKKNVSMKPFTPAYALVEVMMHELSNPVQAARTTLRLLQDDQISAADALSRMQGLETALERVAVVIRNVQAVKDSALTPPSSVSSEQLLNDISTECLAYQIPIMVEAWPQDPVVLRLHGAAIPILLTNWAAGAREEQQKLSLSLKPGKSGWALNACLRDGMGEIVSRVSSAVAVAGYPAAIGEFMRSAGGNAIVKEDDTGTFEIDLNIETWT